MNKRLKVVLSSIFAAALAFGAVTPAVADGDQTIYLKGKQEETKFVAAGWQDIIELGGATLASLASGASSAWHLELSDHSAEEMKLVKFVRVTFTNGEFFDWPGDAKLPPSANNGGKNLGWVIIAPSDWVIDTDKSYLVTSDTGNPQFNISGFHHEEPTQPPAAQDLTISLSAEAAYPATYAWEVTKTAKERTVTIKWDETDAIDYEVVVKYSSTASNYRVAGAVVVTNPNTGSAADVAVTLSTTQCTFTGKGSTTTIGSLQGSETLAYSCDNVDPATIGQISATVTWGAISDGSVTPNHSATSNVATLTADSFQAVPVNSKITVVDKMDNAAERTLGTVDLADNDDPVTPDDVEGDKDADQGTVTFTYSHPFTAADLGDRTNEAKACTEAQATCHDGDATIKVIVEAYAPEISKSVEASYVTTHDWTVSKQAYDADGNEITSPITVRPDSPADVTYKIVVTHTGSTYDLTVTGKVTVDNSQNSIAVPFTLTEMGITGMTCVFDRNQSASITGAWVQAGATITLDYTCTGDTLTVKPTDVTNTVKAGWGSSQPLANGWKLPVGSADVTETATATPSTPVNASITVVDTLDPEEPQELGTVSADADGTLTSTGGVVDGATATFTETRTFDKPGEHTNIAAIIDTDDKECLLDPDPDPDNPCEPIGEDEETVDVKGDLYAPDIKKSAEAAYTTVHGWSVDKQAYDANNQPISSVKVGPDAVTVTYKIAVTHKAPTYALTVKGAVTVDNTKNPVAVPFTLTEAGIGIAGMTCVFDRTQNASITGAWVQAKTEITLGYTCTADGLTTKPADLTNTVKAGWGSATALEDGWKLPVATDQAVTATATAEETAVKYDSVTVTDTMDNQEVTLGTVSVGADGALTRTPDVYDGKPVEVEGQTVTFSYDRTFASPDLGTRINLAELYDTKCKSDPDADCQPIDDDDAKVVVTTGTVLGGHTKGFWQNKNGQAVINQSAIVIDDVPTCGVAVWLNGLMRDALEWNGGAQLPETDSSAVGNGNGKSNKKNEAVNPCNGAYDAIALMLDGANGKDMHSQLRAQMLATALAVYFSDPAHDTAGLYDAPYPLADVQVDVRPIWGNPWPGSTDPYVTIGEFLSQIGNDTKLWDDGTAKPILTMAKNLFAAINEGTAVHWVDAN
jgi:hypothetical protein